MKRIFTIAIVSICCFGCSKNKIEKKGFQVSEITEDENGEKIVGLHIDSLKLETRPRNVLLTNNKNHRLTPVYKVNYHKKTKKPFTGSNSYHSTYHSYEEGNNWNNNFMPGFEAIYGYNFVNVYHYNNTTKKGGDFFKAPVLIKTFYFPAQSKDTLNYEPINRNYYMVSVYDEDTNKDGYITVKDLRKFYFFDIDGNNRRDLIPANYSVMNSEYDYVNDYMYVFAKKDVNNNGQMELDEPTDIFWIDLKDPSNLGLQYQTK